MPCLRKKGWNSMSVMRKVRGNILKTSVHIVFRVSFIIAVFFILMSGYLPSIFCPCLHWYEQLGLSLLWIALASEVARATLETIEVGMLLGESIRSYKVFRAMGSDKDIEKIVNEAMEDE